MHLYKQRVDSESDSNQDREHNHQKKKRILDPRLIVLSKSNKNKHSLRLSHRPTCSVDSTSDDESHAGRHCGLLDQCTSSKGQDVDQSEQIPTKLHAPIRNKVLIHDACVYIISVISIGTNITSVFQDDAINPQIMSLSDINRRDNFNPFINAAWLSVRKKRLNTLINSNALLGY